MTTEIGKRADFSHLRYAQCWEDADLLLAALEPARHHRLLSVASAGDNTLALVAQGVERVVAVDMSAAQIAALDLRVAAYQQLDYPATMQLLGVHLAGDASQEQAGAHMEERRLDLYAVCRPHLSPTSQRFWDEHAEMIGAGIIAQGRFERYLRLFSQRILPLIHPAKVRHALLQPRSPKGRCQFYAEVWDTWRWRCFFRIFFSRLVMGRLGRDPAFFRYAESDIATTILARTRQALTTLDPTRNPYLQWILLGQHGPALPFALRAQNFAAIRHNLPKLEWHTATLEEYLNQAPQGYFHGFNLSNVFEYMSLPAYHALLEQLLSTAHYGARLVYWNLLARRRRPTALADRLESLETLATTLHQQDRAFFYSALVIEQVTSQLLTQPSIYTRTTPNTMTT
jgi:S-adenosylmethionine-diacylglycerol 3-amino-3-carboxypropyl transferase